MPLSIRSIIALLLLGLFSNVALITAVVPSTFGLWCPGWTYGPLVVLSTSAVVLGLFFATPSPRLGSLTRVVAVMQIAHFINCDWVSVIVGSLVLWQLKNPDSVAYFAGTYERKIFVLPEGGDCVLKLELTLFPLSLPLYLYQPEVVVGDHAQHLDWGKHEASLPAGEVEVRIFIPVLGSPLMVAEHTLQIEAGEVVKLRYTAPIAFFLPGQLRASRKKTTERASAEDAPPRSEDGRAPADPSP
jgi:hypothetical protein